MREYFEICIPSGATGRRALRARSYRFHGESTEHVDIENAAVGIIPFTRDSKNLYC